MRDLIVTAFMFGSLPLIVWRPYIGVLMWVVVSVMNPHRFTYGFAFDFPFALIIAAVTLLSLLIRPVPKNLPMTGPAVGLIAFVLWMNVSTLLALLPDEVYGQWERVMKTMLMVFATMILIRDRRQIRMLIWAVAISLGFYGIKGGIFTIATDGTARVWGPVLSTISDNNEIALALVMAIPLMYYLRTTTERKLVVHGLTVTMILTVFAVLGTYSRGAMLALGVVVALLALKSRKKLRITLVSLIGLPLMIAFMPEKWISRMDTIHAYEQDLSALGRLNAWEMTYNLAKDHPIVGGGFEIYRPEFFMIYAPDPTNIHVAHSVYFQALGEHGFVGLGLYLLLAFLTWRNVRWIVRHAKNKPEYKWAGDLAAMLQVSLIGFAIGGAFLSLLYFDVPYYLMAAIAATRTLLKDESRRAPADDRKDSKIRQETAAVQKCRSQAILSRGRRFP